MPLSISYHLPISSASSCTFLWNEIQIAIKINLWSCICICLKGLNRLSQRNEALIVGNSKQSQDFKLWPRKTDKANKPDWIVGKMKGNGMYPRRHGFSLKKICVSKQEATGEGLLCLQVFLRHLCLLIWTQHCSLRRDSLKFRQLRRVQFCVSETSIHVFAFYSKMPACIYLIFKITVVFIFISFWNNFSLTKVCKKQQSISVFPLFSVSCATVKKPLSNYGTPRRTWVLYHQLICDSLNANLRTCLKNGEFLLQSSMSCHVF